MNFIVSLLVTGLIIAVASWITPGVAVAGFGWAIITGLIIGFVNATVGTILRLFTAPLNWLTLGLISFIITVLMVLFTDWIMGGKFEVSSFWSAALFAIIVAVVEVIIGSLSGKKN